MSTARERIKRQREVADRLQEKLLARYEKMLDGEIECTSTDLATITRFLGQQGWTLDPAAIPKELEDFLKDTPTFSDDDEGSVIELHRKRA